MNEAFGLVNEFIIRTRLARIGYSAADLKELDADKAHYFILVDNEMEKAKAEAEKQAMKRKK